METFWLLSEGAGAGGIEKHGFFPISQQNPSFMDAPAKPRAMSEENSPNKKSQDGEGNEMTIYQSYTDNEII